MAGPRPRDDRDVAQNLARDLADIAGQLATLKGEAYNWLSIPEYNVLRHRLEDAHALVEAATIEANRRVRLNEGRVAASNSQATPKITNLGDARSPAGMICSVGYETGRRLRDPTLLRPTKEKGHIGMKKTVLLASMALAVLLAGGVTLTAGTVPARAAFPGTNGKIVFAEENSLNGNNNGIRLINPSGTGLSTLVANAYPAEDTDPAFSPNGTRVAYASRKAGQPDLRMEIYKINVATRGITQITTNTQFDGNPTWKPDGTRIAFEHERSLAGGGKDTDIFVKRSDGTGKMVNKTMNPREDDLAPAWSPDGEEIAFNTGTSRDIIVLNLDTGQRRNLTNDGTANWDSSPSWTPDGTRIVYASVDSDFEYRTIYTVNATDGSDRRELARGRIGGTEYRGLYLAQSAYSPDSERIVYVRAPTDYVNTRPQLYTMNAADGSDKRLVYNAYKSGPGEYPYTEEVFLYSPDWGEQRPH
jgi:Tol biopolymer transport system component